MLQGQHSQPYQVCRRGNLQVPLPETARETLLQSGWSWSFQKSHLKPSFLHLLAQAETLVHSGASEWPGFGNLPVQMWTI